MYTVYNRFELARKLAARGRQSGSVNARLTSSMSLTPNCVINLDAYELRNSRARSQALPQEPQTRPLSEDIEHLERGLRFLSSDQAHARSEMMGKFPAAISLLKM